MTEPEWIDDAIVRLVHEQQIAEHGGLGGIRDEGLLASALARPRNSFAYGGADLAGVAAAYGYGLARNHPFVDGNKRTAFVVTEAFLGINGYDLVASDVECIAVFMDLAAGAISEDELASWLRENMKPR